jgi:hypothetical protein
MLTRLTLEPDVRVETLWQKGDILYFPYQAVCSTIVKSAE